MFLLDTNVVSELRKASSRRADPGVLEWARKVPVNTLFISVVSLMELRIGIGLVARRDPEQATALSRWFETPGIAGLPGADLAYRPRRRAQMRGLACA